MPLTLKNEATTPAVANVLQQQARFDAWVAPYNQERPHQALGMKVPADVYARSPRVYRGLEDLTYPVHDQTISSRRITIMQFRPANIRVINRRDRRSTTTDVAFPAQR